MIQRSWLGGPGCALIVLILLGYGQGWIADSNPVERLEASTRGPAQTSSQVTTLRHNALTPTRTTARPTSTPTVQASPTTPPSATLTGDPELWKSRPVVPQISQVARATYQRGIERGNDPRRFSKIGDCQNIPSYFLAVFDRPADYTLGVNYEYLRGTIEWYAGSFSRNSVAARSGFNAASILSPRWADPQQCIGSETPLDCELRLHRPSAMIVSLETWWAGDTEKYAAYLRRIVDTALAHDVVPILATKADDIEGGHRINAAIAALADEYSMPLWNFWLAAQPLPAHGLSEDGFHLTYAGNRFDDPARMKAAWPWRNLTALQVLDSLRQELSQP